MGTDQSLRGGQAEEKCPSTKSLSEKCHFTVSLSIFEAVIKLKIASFQSFFWGVGGVKKLALGGIYRPYPTLAHP